MIGDIKNVIEDLDSIAARRSKSIDRTLSESESGVADTMRRRMSSMKVIFKFTAYKYCILRH